MRVISWIVRVYWSLDIFLSFFVGFYDSGRLVVKLERTVKHYLTSWFLLDITVVCLDWVFLILESVGDGVDGVPRLSKTVRIDWEDWGMARLVMNHVIACIWFGMTSVEDEQNWVLANQLDGRSGLYQYATSLHWSIAQLGVGQTEIEAVSLMERTFSICVMLGALLSFSTLVSSMTSLMQRLDHLKTDEAWRMALSLADGRARDHAIDKHGAGARSHLSERTLTGLLSIFNLINLPKHFFTFNNLFCTVLILLRRPNATESGDEDGELQLERHRECLLQSAFFSSMLHSDFNAIDVLRDLAVSALCHAVVAKGDVVFAAGSVDAGPSTGGAGGAVAFSPREHRLV
eukprot:g16244.t1